jgi:RNA polymerase sigma-54 factor
MGIETGLSLRLQHRLAITPMLQVAIKLLQLSRLELLQVLQQHVMENPLLEEDSSIGTEEPAEIATDGSHSKGENENVLDLKAEKSDFDWESYLENASDSFSSYSYGSVRKENWELPSLEDILSKPRSISEHLLLQLHISTEEDDLIKLGNYLIGNLDENGYLRVTLDEAAKEIGLPLKEAEKALGLIQSLDPPGIAARDLKECLLLQLVHLGQGEGLAAKIITHFMKELEEKRWNGIADKLNVPLDEIKNAIQQIGKLDPKPARSFCTEDPQYIMPDLFVYKVEGDYEVALNDEGLPRLRISPYYRRIIAEKRWDNAETHDYIAEKMRQAIWLIRSIEQRQRTLYKVGQSLVKFQRRFLDDGISFLRPLTLRDVAEDISMHESTVSRVTTNKYVYTPQGIFELKYFFHRGLSSQNGGIISSVNVKEQLRRIISEEGGEKPISDQRLAEGLRSKGINISRRTIAKYRAQLRIPSSSRRKRL